VTDLDTTSAPSGTPLGVPAGQSPSASNRSNSLAGGLWELVQVLVLAVLMVTVIRNFVQNYRIDGISMEPNFHDGQFLIVNRFAYCPGIYIEVPLVNQPVLEKRWCTGVPRRGDVVIFEYPRDPSRDFIKRVIGLPGETVEIRQGGVYINGVMMPQPFGPNPGSYSADPIVVGPDEVYVMGDNRNNSSDSHLWGPLKQEMIIGEALVSYWPPQNWAVVPQYDLTDLTAYAQAP
jgi:signal peptidase I